MKMLIVYYREQAMGKDSSQKISYETKKKLEQYQQDQCKKGRFIKSYKALIADITDKGLMYDATIESLKIVLTHINSSGSTSFDTVKYFERLIGTSERFNKL